ncbi:Sugar transporter family protein [Fonsecaea pedrosoi]|nr:Sugar transporter family protein [Fonsecaea pedrosoi]
MALSPSAIRLLIVLFVALGSLTYGYSASIIATTLGQPSFIAYFELDTRSNATQLTGAINGLFQTGGLFGTLSCTKLPDWLGRRKALLLNAVITVIGGALQAGSVDIGMYIAMRFVTGWGIGGLVTLVPLYQSEIAPPRIRGWLVGMHGVLICVGYAAASWIGLGFYFVNASGAQWRLPLAIQCFPPLFLALGVLFLPESPRWLVDRDRVDEAYRSFKAVRAERTDDIISDDLAIRAEFNLLQGQILHERLEVLSFIDLWRKPSMRKRCIVGFLALFGCQGTATLVINNYGPSLYSSLGFNTVQQLLIQSGWITVCPFGNYINALIVDRVGRTRLLVFGFSGTILALIGECITVSIFQRTGDRGVAGAAVFFLFLHITFFSCCCDATSYIYAAEIFPTPVRAKGLAVSISGLFIATIIFLQAAPTAFANIGWKYYIVFIVVTSLITLTVLFWFPETKGLSLEDIGELFGDSIEPTQLDEKMQVQEETIEDLDAGTQSEKHVQQSVSST